MNSYRRQLAVEITEHLQSTLDSDIDYVYEWLKANGYDTGDCATELVMEFAEKNELPSQAAGGK